MKILETEKSLRGKSNFILFIPIFVILGMIAMSYSYCFVMEHEILSVKQKSLDGRNEFTITATCRPVNAFTSAPYISVKNSETEIISAAINSGYDLTSDCLSSSVESIQLIESDKKVKIYMKNGQVKEMPILLYIDNDLK